MAGHLASPRSNAHVTYLCDRLSFLFERVLRLLLYLTQHKIGNSMLYPNHAWEETMPTQLTQI